MKRKLSIIFIFMVICSRGIFAHPAMKTAHNGIEAILKLSRNEAAFQGILFGLCSFGFGIATKKCWKKTKYWFNRERMEYHHLPNGRLEVVRDSRMHFRDMPPAIGWCSLTGFYALGTAFFGIPAIACLFRACRLTLGKN